MDAGQLSWQIDDKRSQIGCSEIYYIHESGTRIGIMEPGISEWDTYLCTAFIGLDEVLVVELSPCEDVTPVAKVIGTVRKSIPENPKINKIYTLYIYNVHVQRE